MKKYRETESLKDLAKFHTVYSLPVLGTPQIPDEKRCKLRVNLLQEELEELVTAIGEKDLVEVADAFADLQYVLSGAIHEFGMGEKFKELFDEVHRSNMSKTCDNLQDAKTTQEHYRAKDGTESYVEEIEEGKYIVYRKGDGKVLKSVNYSPADLESILQS